MSRGYFFLPEACLAAAACLLFWSALLALACFCVDFFCVDLGDLSPMMFAFYYGLTHRWHVSFAADNGQDGHREGDCKCWRQYLPVP